MSWIQTYTGEVFYPLEPSVTTINIVDIAHALAMVCRFNGHTSAFYSVAEHCVRMSEQVPPEMALHALLHDAAEAYVSDVARPIKPHLGGFDEIEDNLLACIHSRYGLTREPYIEQALKVADLRMLATERAQLMVLQTPHWDCLEGIDPYDIYLECWNPEKAERVFMNRFLLLRHEEEEPKAVLP